MVAFGDALRGFLPPRARGPPPARFAGCARRVMRRAGGDESPAAALDGSRSRAAQPRADHRSRGVSVRRRRRVGLLVALACGAQRHDVCCASRARSARADVPVRRPDRFHVARIGNRKLLVNPPATARLPRAHGRPPDGQRQRAGEGRVDYHLATHRRRSTQRCSNCSFLAAAPAPGRAAGADGLSRAADARRSNRDRWCRSRSI